MKKIMKSRIFLVIITMIICISGTLYAATTYKASDVVYNASDGTSMSVNDALNELYNKKTMADINYEIVSFYVWNNGTTSYSNSFELDSTKTYVLYMQFANNGQTATHPYISSTDGEATQIGLASVTGLGKGYWYVVKNASTITVKGTAKNTNNGIPVWGLSY